MSLRIPRAFPIVVCALASSVGICRADEPFSSADVAVSTNATAAASASSSRRVNITSDMTHYDRKEGLAVFTGHVFVNDEQYQLHADKAYVFMTAANALKRIVAVGHVAMTNEFKYAYGAKASYYKDSGMVVLYGGDGVNAEVVDATKGADQKQTLRGSKIKFWVDSEQVEVLDATIAAPMSSTGSVGFGGLR